MSNVAEASAVYTCSLPGCGQTFRRRDYLRRHEVMHTDKREHTCNHCGKSFGRSDVLTRHKKKCSADSAETSSNAGRPDINRRSASPYSPRRGSPTRRGDGGGAEDGGAIPFQGLRRAEEAGLLGIMPITTSAKDRWRGKKRARSSKDQGNGDDMSSSGPSSDGDNLLERRAGRRERTAGQRGSREETRRRDRDRIGRESVATSAQPLPPEHMPILDVDFPSGFNGPPDESVIGVDILQGSASDGMSQTAYQLPDERPYNVPLAHQPSTALTLSLTNQPIHQPIFTSLNANNNTSLLSPLDHMDFLDNVPFAPQSFDAQPGLIATSDPFLPDANFDFEAFFASITGDPGVTAWAEPWAPVPADFNPIIAGQPKSDSAKTTSTPSTVAAEMKSRIGPAPSSSTSIHVPVDRFKAYYQMAHWSLPPLVTLTSFAERTRDEILPHFGMIHAPTFRLDMLSTCLAFTLCIIGSLGSATNRLAEQRHPSEYDWDMSPIVRNEMTILIMKSFSVSKRMTMSDYNLALNQALLLLQAPEILSDHPHERTRANMFRTTIVNTARQLECFNPKASQARSEIRLPIEPWTYFELDLFWRRWIQLETRRRTAFYIYNFDMLVTIETSIPCLCSPQEVAHLPLPSPKSLWAAESSDQWLRAAKRYRASNLDETLRRLFHPSTKPDTPTKDAQLDPFALNVLILTILRGVVDIGEGRRGRDDWYSLTDLWLHQSEADEWIAATFSLPASRSALLDRFTQAVQIWKSWWDALPDGALTKIPGTDRVPLCEDALPVYWLVHALLGVLTTSTPIEARRAFIARINFGEMLATARNFSRSGEGPVMRR